LYFHLRSKNNYTRKLLDIYILKYFFFSSIFVILDFIFYLFLLNIGFNIFLSFFISAFCILIVSYIFFNILIFRKKPTAFRFFLYLLFHLLSIIFFSNLNEYIYINIDNYILSKAIVLPISFFINYFFTKYIILYKSNNI